MRILQKVGGKNEVERYICFCAKSFEIHAFFIICIFYELFEDPLDQLQDKLKLHIVILE